MSDLQIAVAPVEEHAALNEYYAKWGYRRSIVDSDVVFVARIDGEPIGIVRRKWEFGVLMLRGMYVAPEHHRRGVGSRLLAAFVADLPPEDCYCVPFAHLPGFYAQGGFVRLDEAEAPEFLRERLAEYRAEGRAVLVMRRPATRGNS